MAEDTSSEKTETTKAGSDVLVVYFSATGTTKGVGDKIAGITGADIYEIKSWIDWCVGRYLMRQITN